MEGTRSAKRKIVHNAEKFYLASMDVKIRHTVGGQKQEFFFFFFQNAYLMVMPVETWATTKEKIAKIYALSIGT